MLQSLSLLTRNVKHRICLYCCTFHSSCLNNGKEENNNWFYGGKTEGWRRPMPRFPYILLVWPLFPNKCILYAYITTQLFEYSKGPIGINYVEELATFPFLFEQHYMLCKRRFFASKRAKQQTVLRSSVCSSIDTFWFRSCLYSNTHKHILYITNYHHKHCPIR